MDAKEYISGFSNKELCKKWNNNIPASELQEQGFYLAADSQEIIAILDNFGMFINPEIITGIIYTIGEADYKEVYVTEWSRPYSLNAIYHPFEYYL